MSKYYCGVDIGSSFAKCVILDEDKSIVSSSIIRNKPNRTESANLVVLDAIKSVDEIRGINDFEYIIGTGYGRANIEFANENISEISCHAKGVHASNPDIRVFLDIGGQDLKFIIIDENGYVDTYEVNDKCQAGIGSFFEQMASFFDISLEEFSDLSLKAKEVYEISIHCNLYVRNEIILGLQRNIPTENVAMGIQFAVARRCHALSQVGLKGYEKVKSELAITLTGGCAKNQGLIYALEKVYNKKISELKSDPQLMGALGAAIFAHERN